MRNYLQTPTVLARPFGCAMIALVFMIATALSQEADSERTKIKDEAIAGISARVLSEYRSAFKTRFVYLLIQDADYSRVNLEKIWRHYCAKYDKADRLDVRIYSSRSFEYDQAFEKLPMDVHTGEVIGPDGTRFKLRGPDARFERKGDGVLAYGGDNETMYYRPSLDAPEKMELIDLAGKGVVR